MAAALSDDGYKMGKILVQLRKAFPDVEWKSKLNSNMIRGYYQEETMETVDVPEHFLITFFNGSKKYEASLRSYKAVCNTFNLDPIEAILELKEKLNAKEKILKKAIEAITKEGDDKNE